MLKKMSITMKISLIFIVMIILLISAISSSVYFQFNKIMRNQLLDSMNNIMEQNKLNIDNLIDSVNLATNYVFQDRNTYELLNSRETDPLKIIYNTNTINQRFRYYINLPLTNTLSMYEAYFFIDKGMPFSDSLPSKDLSNLNDYTIEVSNNKLVSSEPWYINTKNVGGAFYWFTRPETPENFYMARYINNTIVDLPNESPPSIGMIVIGFNLVQLGKHIEASKLTPHTEIILADEKWNILYGTDKNNQKKNISGIIPSFKQSKSSLIEGTNLAYKGKSYITKNYNIRWGWNLLVLTPVDDISEQISIIQKIIFLISGFVLILGVGLTFLVSNTISRPIKKLASIMKTVKNNDSIYSYIPPPSSDEVGFLYESFNEMMARIDAQVKDIYISAVKEKNAELKALQAQINPHFLYNTLDSISWLAISSNEVKISKMVSSLSFIMRYSIKNSDKLVPLSQELEHVKNYINIQSLRYKDVFDVEYAINNEILNYQSPKFIIQPLVENAILHAFQKSNSKGLLTIYGEIFEGSVIITVRDNGSGADTGRINEYLDGKQSISSKSDSIGIINVHQRIQLCFSSNYGLKYFTNSSGGVSAKITIPIIISHEDSSFYVPNKWFELDNAVLPDGSKSSND